MVFNSKAQKQKISRIGNEHVVVRSEGAQWLCWLTKGNIYFILNGKFVWKKNNV